jgi:Homeodomain-like domain
MIPEAMEARCRAPSTPQGEVKRARIVLLAAEGFSTRSIAKEVGVSAAHCEQVAAPLCRSRTCWAERSPPRCQALLAPDSTSITRHCAAHHSGAAARLMGCSAPQCRAISTRPSRSIPNVGEPRSRSAAAKSGHVPKAGPPRRHAHKHPQEPPLRQYHRTSGST